jgi:hypothetical protein
VYALERPDGSIIVRSGEEITDAQEQVKREFERKAREETQGKK